VWRSVRRVVPLPDRTDGLPRKQCVLDSAHHGLAIDGDGRRVPASGEEEVVVIDHDRARVREGVVARVMLQARNG
jgi:hypothetical protein